MRRFVQTFDLYIHCWNRDCVHICGGAVLVRDLVTKWVLCSLYEQSCCWHLMPLTVHQSDWVSMQILQRRSKLQLVSCHPGPLPQVSVGVECCGNKAEMSYTMQISFLHSSNHHHIIATLWVVSILYMYTFDCAYLWTCCICTWFGCLVDLYTECVLLLCFYANMQKLQHVLYFMIQWWELICI